jgi:hypothetical protein
VKYGARAAVPQERGAREFRRPARPASENFRTLGHNPIYSRENSKSDSAAAMNASPEMSFDEMLRVKLEVLRREHRDLDEAIHALETTGRPDQLTLRRLKKQKLALKDAITRIEDQLIPDIIA